MADLILIPVLALLFVGAKRYDNGFNKDYLSKDNTLALKGACALSIASYRRSYSSKITA